MNAPLPSAAACAPLQPLAPDTALGALADWQRRGWVRIAHQISGRVRLKLAPQALLDAASASEASVQQGVQQFQQQLQALPGVRSVAVNLLARSCTVEYDPQELPDAAWGDWVAARPSAAAAQLQRLLAQALPV